MFRKMKWLVAVLLVCGIYTGTTLAELIGYWPFEEGQGTETADITGNGNDGTFNGEVEWVPGYIGNGVRFDTAGERIVIGPLDPSAGTNAMTLAAWINWEGQGHEIAQQGIIGKRLGWDPGTGVKWFWQTNPAGDLLFRADNAQGGDSFGWGNGLLVDYVNEWVHVAVTWDNGATIQYINAEEASTGNVNFRDTADDTPMTIGCVQTDWTETFVGTIDEARIYNHALTPAELETIMLGIFPTAHSPDPPDGAIHEDTWITISWQPGTSAVSHDVYFGENFDDVNDATHDSEVFQGNQVTTFYIAGFPGYAYPEGLVPGTTYYWRIDEVEADGTTIHKGYVWRFTVPSRKAYNPYPVDGAKFIATDVILKWAAGLNAKLHHVYFGDDPDVVASATGALPRAATTYIPGPLELEKTYYWRVDEFDGSVMHTGDVWSFTTLPEIPVTDPSLVGWWKFDEGMGQTAVDWSGQGNHGALQGDPQWVPGQVGGALEFDGDGDFVNCGANDVFDIATNISVMCWIKVHQFNKSWQAIVTQGDNSWRLHRSSNTDNITWGTSGLDPTDITGSMNVNDEEWHHVAGVYNGSQKILYVDGNIDASADTTGSIASSTYRVNIGENAQATGRHWAGLIDDVRIYNKALTAEEIKEAMRGEPDLAWNPSPGNGSTVYIADAMPLTWSPGDFAAEHDVYFGLDRSAVDDADASDTTGVYQGRQSGTSYTPPEGVAWGGGPYYWRIDEINTDGTISKGRIWTFSVLDFALIEDFESYTDDDTAGLAIWQHWIDGFGIADNGSQVGYLLPPYAEQTVVHGGRQSMPLLYVNEAGVTNSEAEYKLTWPRDWTEENVGVLSLWFHGLPGSVGSFVEGPVGTYTMTGSGADITGPSDEFHYAYKTLTGAGSITARIVSVQNTHAWAKAGVMIRQSLDPDSPHAMAFVTPGNGVVFEYRSIAGTDNVGAAGQQQGITAPHWVKLERDVGGNFSVYQSANGTTWQVVSGATPQNISMGSNVYIGLALTSHDAALTCRAVFSNVTTTGSVSGQWQNQDIGITSNSAEPLYVAISNATGAPAIVANTDPAAATIDAWTNWRIPLQSFADQGINLSNVDKIAIGLGSKSGMVSAGGTGTIYIDDIRLYRP